MRFVVGAHFHRTDRLLRPEVPLRRRKLRHVGPVPGHTLQMSCKGGNQRAKKIEPMEWRIAAAPVAVQTKERRASVHPASACTP